MHRYHGLTEAELAARLKRAVANGGTVKAYCRKRGWNYHAVYARLVRADLWAGVMVAKYAARESGQ